MGSSPRMRGAQIGGHVQVPFGGIIPADAGSTLPRMWVAHRDQDHPRGCGEHRSSRSSSMCQCGSSPRMRGAHTNNPLGYPRIWIIPADAGSTVSYAENRGLLEDHPRGCGEHLISRLIGI